jgi:CheY-like chemotaxis protein
MAENYDQINVLIIDDNPSCLGLLKAMLTHRGFLNVTEASSGKEALRLARRNKPDLCLVDIQMPEMDGWELTAHLREEFPETLIVMATASKDAKDIDNAFEKRVDGYFLKPYQPDLFFQTIDRLLERAAQRSR